MVEQAIRITGLKNFGEYMSQLLTIDAFFLNEDRHTHNIAVLMDSEGTYHYCPVFDEQLDAIEGLYGQHLKFHFSSENVQTLLENEMYYPDDIKERVKRIILAQKRKYEYLFSFSHSSLL